MGNGLYEEGHITYTDWDNEEIVQNSVAKRALAFADTVARFGLRSRYWSELS